MIIHFFVTVNSKLLKIKTQNQNHSIVSQRSCLPGHLVYYPDQYMQLLVKLNTIQTVQSKQTNKQTID